MAYLVAGPLITLVGIVAVFFVFRRKSVDKRSMYSARRQQIEHKVRAARQRTLTPRGREAKPAAQAPVAASPFDQQQGQAFEYFTPSTSPGAAPPPPAVQTPAFEATQAMPPTPPPSAPPAQPQWEQPAEPQQMPWDVPAAAASAPPGAPPPAPPTFDFPSSPTAPPEPFRPAPEPTPMPQPSEPAWTPAPQPSAPATQIEQPVAASTSSTVGGWSVVTTTKESAEPGRVDAAPEGKKKKKKSKAEPVADGSWQLASGELPGMEAEEPEVKRPNGTVVALVQYAVLVVGLVMVLVGVLVMVANSHVS